MKFLQKTIPVIFIVMFSYILILLFFFGNIDYINQRNYLLSNIFSIIFIIIIFFIFFFFKNIKDFSNKKYYIVLAILSLVLFFVQMFVEVYGYFTPTWDAGHLLRTVEHFLNYKVINDMEYMTRYPNNTMLTFMLILFRNIPFFGNSNFIFLFFNSLLVNISAIFTSLTVKNLTHNNRYALSSYIFLIPLVVLSPWILVVYSDTFALVFPILVLYIYTKDKKDCYDYFFICLLSLFGYYIKPTVIIVLLAIIIVELLTNLRRILNFRKWNLKVVLKNISLSLLGFLVVFSINAAARVYVEYYQVPNVVEFKLVHFIAMGLNEETQGIFNGSDVDDSIKYGMNQNIDKIKKRLSERSLKEHLDFFSKKTLVNYNDGSFAWGKEGAFFLNVKKQSHPIKKFINNIFTHDGSFYKVYLLIAQWFWLTLLFYIPFCVKKANSKKELVVMLTLIGITLFLTLFEARARYLYCYSPIYVVAFVLGNINVLSYTKKWYKKK